MSDVKPISSYAILESNNTSAQSNASSELRQPTSLSFVRRLFWWNMKATQTTRVQPCSDVDTLSDAEILSLCNTAPNICPSECQFGPWACPTILRISNDTVVKYAIDLSSSEASAMELVRSKTTIPIPAVRRFINGHDGGYLAMEYVEGQTLLKCWGDLSWWRRLRIMWILRGYVRQLRRVRTKKVETPGPVGDTPTKCIGRHFTEDGAGPFATSADMTAWYIGRLTVTQNQPWADPSIITHPPTFDNSKPLVLTHQDLNMRNVILGRDEKVWLLDWGWSGYYPPWFEYAGMDSYDEADFPRSWLRMIPFIAGFHRKKMAFLGMIPWALTTGRRMKP